MMRISSPRCTICGSGNTSRYDDDVTRCSGCDAIFRDTPSNTTSQFLGNSGRRENWLQVKFWDLMARPCVEYLKKTTPMNFGNVLDVGTYFGHFVKMMNREGCSTRGIEPDRCKIAQAVTDRISQGYFDHTFQTDEVYDLICFNEMVYYIQDGIRALSRAREMLADGGMMFVTTTNPSSSMVKDKSVKGIGRGVEYINCLMSKQNFDSLEGFRMKNCMCFRSDMLIDVKYGRKYMFPLYLAGLKKIITPNPDGNKMFVLLEKTG